ncbi:sulfotransferase 1A1-like [Littorina saxatilis]|uniref:Sulfotransferase domain-containing protein n=1 Tax=Littorina saxatilis TaxID=31220 RepID=A0AAN9AL98_9CAEN
MPLLQLPDAGGKTLLVVQYGDEGYLGPPDIPQEQLEDIHNIEIRDDDVILCSYPKSGCHWLWEMTRMLRAGTAEVGVVEKEKYMMEYTPQKELPSPRTLNTHLFLRQLPKKIQDGKVKLLFVYRNPKDVAVSFYNHHVKFPEYEYQGSFHDYLPALFLKGKVDFGGIFEYTRDWEAVFDSRPDLDVFTVSYEQLQSDTFSKAKELAKFLGSTADDDTILEIVNKCSFGSMRERKGKEWIAQYGEAVMYRKGKVGDWKTWFTVAESEMMDSICEKEMKGSKFKFQYTL